MAKKCYICNKPIVLVPSAQERSLKTGYPASYFTKQFTSHSECFIKKRSEETSELIRRVG